MNGIIRSLLFSDGFNSIIKETEIYLKRSEASLIFFNIPYLNKLIVNYRKDILSMRREFHKIQNKYFFGEKYIKLFNS